MSSEISKKVMDPVQVFEAFVMFGGNATKVAVACDIATETVEQLAKEGGWHAKVKRWDELSEGNSQGVQIAINRGVNYIQAARLRSLVDKVVKYLSEGSAEDLIAKLTCETAHGPQFKTRAITDLTKAAEAAQLMTMRALGDNPEERPSGGERKESTIALSVLAALNAATEVGLDSVEVVRKQLATPHDESPNTPPAS